MDISRRSFLRGALVVPAVCVLPSPLALAEDMLATLSGHPSASFDGIPTLYGDGIHDDKDGLEALFNGRKVRIDGEVVQAFEEHDIYLYGGTYAVSDTVYARRRFEDLLHGVHFNGATFKFMEGKSAECLMCFDSRWRPAHPYSMVLQKKYALG